MVLKRWVPQQNIDSVGLFQHTLAVRKGFEPFHAVIAAKAAITHSAKRQIGISQVDERVVDASPAEGDRRNDALFECLVPGKQV